MHNNVMISCIVPFYNRENYLKQCVESIENQTHTNFEILLINDGSTDKSLDIARTFENSDNRIHVFSTENLGVCHARNIGLEQCKGDYICFVDSDDELDPNAFRILLDLIIANNAQIAIGQYSNIKRIMKPNSCAEDNLYLWEGKEALKNALLDSPFTYTVWGKLYKKDLLYQMQFENGRIIAEDSFFLFKCFIKMPTVIVTNHIIYFVNNSSESLTRSRYSRKKMADTLYFSEQKTKLVYELYPEYKSLALNLSIKAKLTILRGIGLENEYRVIRKKMLNDIYINLKYLIPINKSERIEKICLSFRVFPLLLLFQLTRRKIKQVLLYFSS